MSARDTFAAMVPRELVVPCEHTDATVVLTIEVGDDGRVWVPGLDEVKAALAIGSADLVRQYCDMWRRWLAAAVAGRRSPS